METPVSRSALYGKLAGPLFRSLESATAFCKLRSNPWVELTHWLHQLTQQPDNDILHVLRHYQIPLSDVEKALLRQSAFPEVSAAVVAAIVADWTGIPAGRMVKDEASQVLELPG